MKQKVPKGDLLLFRHTCSRLTWKRVAPKLNIFESHASLKQHVSSPLQNTVASGAFIFVLEQVRCSALMERSRTGSFFVRFVISARIGSGS